MNQNNQTVTNAGWGVSTISGEIPGMMPLHVYKNHQTTNRRQAFISQQGEAYGMTFPNTDEGRKAYEEYCLVHGYLKKYGRNICGFMTNRSFRKHTGKPCIDPTDFRWQIRERSAKFAASQKSQLATQDSQAH